MGSVFLSGTQEGGKYQKGKKDQLIPLMFGALVSIQGNKMFFVGFGKITYNMNFHGYDDHVTQLHQFVSLMVLLVFYTIK